MIVVFFTYLFSQQTHSTEAVTPASERKSLKRRMALQPVWQRQELSWSFGPCLCVGLCPTCGLGQVA